MAGNRGTVAALSISEHQGTPKRNVTSIHVIRQWGIEGDAHAGKTHRQISLLALERIAQVLLPDGTPVRPGMFAENIATEGLALSAVGVGDCLRIGSVLLEVTQIGKSCHAQCAIADQVGRCIMPKEGVFARVRHGGVIQVGDAIEQVAAVPDHPAKEAWCP